MPLAVSVQPQPLVLVVEDDQDSREMYAEWLVYSGFRVVQARCGEEALAKAHELLPDLITADFTLHGGGMDGYELCERLREDARTRAIPVLAVTASAMDSHVMRAWQVGCAAVLIKPCPPDVLLAAIRRFLKVG